MARKMWGWLKIYFNANIETWRKYMIHVPLKEKKRFAID